jgi:hypothetical protein
VTSVVGDNAVIDWVAPDANGSPITSYDIYVKTSTGSFLADAHCDGTAPTVVRDKQCSIPLLTLQVSTTFALSQGDLIEAYIVARNFYGPSGNSNTGNGGTILRVPSCQYLKQSSSNQCDSDCNHLVRRNSKWRRLGPRLPS